MRLFGIRFPSEPQDGQIPVWHEAEHRFEAEDPPSPGASGPGDQRLTLYSSGLDGSRNVNFTVQASAGTDMTLAVDTKHAVFHTEGIYAVNFGGLFYPAVGGEEFQLSGNWSFDWEPPYSVYVLKDPINRSPIACITHRFAVNDTVGLRVDTASNFGTAQMNLIRVA